MDSIDYEILKILQENARISMKDLGKQVGLTAPAVSERIKKLETSKVIKGYTAIIDPAKLGKNIRALINVSIDIDKRKEFMELIKNHSNVISCHHVTGSYSMVVYAIFKEVNDLESLIYQIQRYGSTNTLIILSNQIKRRTIL
ncbi:AsnC family transcriptional regulator [Iocasia frigidifontis]|uniref:AsnC family transcriptional regulator n=1 Tax=Iocasia fonsfrigidae TaxID=2682810 RepID=A0A8A7KGX3_9FIRM|nr:Lrp/AsnC family transcriptional regulator [Iocasia fonsfrigidae]MTI61015.1 Lrp/AsnC family transcriptional regulator [Bacillota bacterium]QTL98137.1 AsnC family transcriptional regulator [Iocasia fonsfrigidae]